MRVFVLDDMERRLEFFRKWYGHHEYVEEKKASPAVLTLKFQPAFDVYFLDHDLEDEHYSSDGYASIYAGGTGYDVAKFIVDELDPLKRPKVVVVHSWNVEAARHMCQLFADHGIRVVRAMFKPGTSFLDLEALVGTTAESGTQEASG